MKSNSLFPETPLIRNYKAARFAVEEISVKYPYGGLNREDGSSKFKMEELSYQIALLNLFRKSSSLGTLDIAADLLLKLEGGYCRELSHLAKSEIESKFKNIKVEVVSLDYHCLLVIGRKENSDPNDIETWGANAVMCDPWARKVYPASKFWDVRYAGMDIGYLAEQKSTGELVRIPNRKHYLEGEPKIKKEEQFYTEQLTILSTKPSVK